jgi:hypothetical protein
MPFQRMQQYFRRHLRRFLAGQNDYVQVTKPRSMQSEALPGKTLNFVPNDGLLDIFLCYRQPQPGMIQIVPNRQNSKKPIG